MANRTRREDEVNGQDGNEVAAVVSNRLEALARSGAIATAAHRGG